MTYQNIPMMTFILATVYLSTVYILLAWAKHTGKKSQAKDSSILPHQMSEKGSLNTHGTEVVNGS
jgi:hypothetical protein